MKQVPSVISPPPSGARFRRRRWEHVILCALFVLSACRQAPPTVDSAVQRLAEAGGSVVLPGGVSAGFGAGFLASAADVTVTLSDTPEAYPSDVAEAYPAGSAEAMAKSVTVSFPSRALGAAGELKVRVPALVPRLEGEERLLFEVHLFLADGQHLFFFQPYARVESIGQPTEASDTVTVSAAQLRPVGAARAENVRVNVRPVRLSNRQLAPQALPSGFVLEDVVSGLNQGVAFAFAGDGRIFVAEKAGVVRVVEKGVLRKTPFIDLSRQVNHFQARGLLGLELPWEGVLRRTPFTVNTIVGGTQQLIAPAQQGSYAFSSWSDGGAATHDITVSAGSKRLVASYRQSVPPKRVSITPLCRDRWRVTNPLGRSVPYRWTIHKTGRKGAKTALPNSVYRLWLPSGSSDVTFYVDGTLYGRLKPNTNNRCP